MCNLYSITTNQAAIKALFRVVNRYIGNPPPMPGGVSGLQGANRPHRNRAPRAPHGAVGNAIVVKGADGCHQEAGRKAVVQGKNVDFKELLRIEPDGGTTSENGPLAGSQLLSPVYAFAGNVGSILLLSSRGSV
jgi:hypothetical protein